MHDQSPTNPFTTHEMIRDPQQFYGRRAELNQIFDRLRTMQGVSLVGERRIGKSSLLYHICLTGRQRLGEELTLVYTDFDDVSDEKSFYRCLCKLLNKDGAGLGDLKEAIHDRRVVFCCDEFERVLRSPAFSREFFDTLRSFAQLGNVALVIATEHPLADLCLTDHIATSPFFNIFPRFDLALFTVDEALGFIRERFDAAEVEITQQEIDRVLQLAGRFSFFLQLACCRLFEAKIGRATEWERDFKRDARDHFQYLWNRLKPSEQDTLRRICGLGGGNEFVIDELERRGLLVQDSQSRNGWSVFSEAFEEVVIRPPAAPLRDRAKRWRLPWLKGIEISLGWPPSIKIQTERPGDKPRTEGKQ